MSSQLSELLRIALNRQVTQVPLLVMKELRKKGINRVPNGSGGGIKNTFNMLKFARHWLKGERLTKHDGQWVLNSFFPPFPSLAYNRMFENMLSGRKFSPVSAFLAVTGDCPFDCVYCSAKNRAKINYSTDQLKDIIKQLYANGLSILGLTGGEPMLRKDLCDIIRYATEKGITTILFTSGYKLDDDMAKHLKASGLWSACMSLDSTVPEEFNKMRNSENAYSTAVDALRCAKAAGLYTMIGAVAHSKFIKSRRHEELYRFAVSNKIDELRFVEPMPCGKLTKNPENFLLSSDDIKAIRAFHVKMNQGRGYTKVCAFNHVEGPDMLGCGAGTQHLYIDSGGEVCPCDFTPMSFGNILNESFVDIWSRMTSAMVMPRRHCFIQKNHEEINNLIEQTDSYPLEAKDSCSLCKKIGHDDYPDYFKTVNQN